MRTCLAILCLWTVTHSISGEECSREKSRIVRNIIMTDLLPVYEEIGAKMPATCPWNLKTDLFGVHEDHKYEDSSNRWVCEFCGKAFYEERYLDLHLSNRHREHMLLGPEAQCLSTHCDLFRCDVVRKRNKPEYWDLALCKETELQQRMQKCHKTLDSCMPALTNTSRTRLFNTLSEKICSYLTCDKYWQIHNAETHPLIAAAYLMGSVMLSVCLFVYYYLAYTHFYTDDSIFDPNHCLKAEHINRPWIIWGGQSVHKRTKANRS